MPPDAMPDGVSVSRETSATLHSYCDDLIRWSKAINLVSETTYEDVWSRHVLDSLQIGREVKGSRLWVDLGSGGGLPAIPIAIFAKECEPECHVVMVESDRRKAAFLKTQVHKHALNASVVNKRVEQLASMRADILSARAFAPLIVILDHAHRHLIPKGTAVLHKGRSAKQELTEARQIWDFDCRIETSMVQDDSVVLRVKNIRKKAAE